MKKIKMLAMVIVLALLLTGCKEKENENIIRNSNVDAFVGSSYGTFEWVSPDGVHYWVVNEYYKYGITPRYDHNGELVIDKE